MDYGTTVANDIVQEMSNASMTRGNQTSIKPTSVPEQTQSKDNKLPQKTISETFETVIKVDGLDFARMDNIVGKNKGGRYLDFTCTCILHLSFLLSLKLTL